MEKMKILSSCLDYMISFLYVLQIIFSSNMIKFIGNMIKEPNCNKTHKIYNVQLS